MNKRGVSPLHCIWCRMESQTGEDGLCQYCRYMVQRWNLYAGRQDPAVVMYELSNQVKRAKETDNMVLVGRYGTRENHTET